MSKNILVVSDSSEGLLEITKNLNDYEWILVNDMRTAMHIIKTKKDIPLIILDLKKTDPFQELQLELSDGLPGLVYRCHNNRDHWLFCVSSGAFELTGYSSEIFFHNRAFYDDLILPAYREPLQKMWQNCIQNKEGFKQIYEIMTATGEKKRVLEIGRGIYDEKGNPMAIEGIVIDLSEGRERDLSDRTFYERDLITGLRNKNYLEYLLICDENDSGKRAVININAGKIRLLYNAYGIQYCRQLTKETADALSVLCTDSCQLFAVYTDQFTFYIKDYKDKEDLTEFCKNISRVLSPVLFKKGVDVGAGILEIICPSTDSEKILRNVLFASDKALADPTQMFTYTFFDQSMEKALRRRDIIRDAISEIAFDDHTAMYMQYQPVIDLNTGEIRYFEALARIRNQELGIVAPDEFIPIAEEIKLIVPVGLKIFYEVFSFLQRLSALGNDSVQISINVSVIQLLRDEFNANLIRLMNEMNISPSRLMIEITESTFMNNYLEINQKISELRSLGIGIAVDDFGTGYSSVNRVRQLKINCVKIEKSFIKGLLEIDKDRAITGDMITLAHRLGCFVIAEGVEHEMQKEYLKEHKCDMIQGYLVSRPMDEDEAIEVILKNDTR